MRIAGEIILKSLGAWVAIWGFSRLLNAPKKLECYTAGVGMIGWAVYLIVEVFNDGILMKNFLAAVAVALVSQAMARHFKAPVILFVIPGILPMVPGAGMYRIVYSIVMGPENMVGTYLLETATAAGAIALGIFLGEALQKIFFYEVHRLFTKNVINLPKQNFLIFFVEFYDILNSVCALGQKKKSIGAFLTSVDKKSPASKVVG